MEVLYSDIIEKQILSLEDCEFKLDDCSCYFIFFNLSNGISAEIRLKKFFNWDYSNVTIYSISCKKNIDSFKRMLDEIKNIGKNGIVVCDTIKDKDEYKKSISHCNVLSIKLDNCWICYDECLNKEHLKCGHLIHTKCAEKYYDMNKKHFKCGICREEYKSGMFFYDHPEQYPEEYTEEYPEEYYETETEEEGEEEGEDTEGEGEDTEGYSDSETELYEDDGFEENDYYENNYVDL
jgi:hypothetical protein